ncbi:30S ribosomal protein S9 [Desulfatibacillum aliphaticivorans]|uniref:Small ribosomal subunit protein uS9 n=1 Tax=Desulfatibacillum aliphaticivorans TaxID=218208 RepID=B8FIZ2_DESAL|nr:30S ribosomal protein S9 [Desulfatibacillum aliphaticivorans]ACL04383.1 ribosomal protein S9 [Desulfatibacillum aliphaticivorans]
MNEENIFYATGKRKSAIARAWLRPGSGNITVNNQPIDKYFTVESAIKRTLQALTLTNLQDSVDVNVTVKGGGFTGQAGAIRHGITKALLEYQPDLRGVLKKAGYITRDPRVKERKKYGQKGARARFQFSKR